VAKQLRRLFPELKVEEEFEDPKSGYSIDIRAERSGAGNASDGGAGGGRVWAVEVDGPTHFLKVWERTEGCAWMMDNEFGVCGVEVKCS
jgi:hypothetical protein